MERLFGTSEPAAQELRLAAITTPEAATAS